MDLDADDLLEDVGIAFDTSELKAVIELKKTEGLELGAVDKLLVGIFVGCDGEEGRILSSLIPDHPIYDLR